MHNRYKYRVAVVLNRENKCYLILKCMLPFSCRRKHVGVWNSSVASQIITICLQPENIVLWTTPTPSSIMLPHISDLSITSCHSLLGRFALKGYLLWKPITGSLLIFHSTMEKLMLIIQNTVTLWSHWESPGSHHFPGGSVAKNLPATQETWVWSLRLEDPLKKEMATHSSILAWIIPWTEEPGRLQSTGLQTARHNFMTKQQWSRKEK